jgi:uncharacterized iron-regulated membrane protein
MKRGAPLKRTPLARVGRKKKGKALARSQTVARVRNRDRTCRFWYYVPPAPAKLHFTINTERCSGHLDVHEITPRSVWPDGDLNDENCVLLCRYHHDWLDHHRDTAELIGLYRRTKP